MVSRRIKFQQILEQRFNVSSSNELFVIFRIKQICTLLNVRMIVLRAGPTVADTKRVRVYVEYIQGVLRIP